MIEEQAPARRISPDSARILSDLTRIRAIQVPDSRPDRQCVATWSDFGGENLEKVSNPSEKCTEESVSVPDGLRVLVKRPSPDDPVLTPKSGSKVSALAVCLPSPDRAQRPLQKSQREATLKATKVTRVGG